MQYDIAIVGAGPAGLSFARALSGSGLRIALIERQKEPALAEPADDGREIAITHHSRRLMCELGLWARLRAEEIGILRDAKVMDGEGRGSLMFRHGETGKPQLGWLVPNHAIRRAAWAEVLRMPEIKLLAEIRALAVRSASDGAGVVLDNGETVTAKLVVAADNRYSHMRRNMGIWATQHDFGKTMLVLSMHHAVPHAQTAWEWFRTGQTLALLPLHDPHTSSVVVTLSPPEMQRLLTLDDESLGASLTERFDRRLGAMRVAGPRCAYPLVGVYAERFVAQRFALIGDAAVGMHPVTAHGFNFGLQGVATLARELHRALDRGQPLWNPAALARYEQRHRRATKPLYLATQMLASLYTDDHPPARLLRKLALHTAERFTPFQRLVVAQLTTERSGPRLPYLPSLWAQRRNQG